MANIELLLNPQKYPIYVSMNNIVYSFSTITIDELYRRVTFFAISAVKIAQILFYTFTFIIQELFNEMCIHFDKHPLTNDKLVILLAVNCLFMFITLHKTYKKVQQQSETIHSLQKQINLLELVRCDNSEVWSEQMQLFMDESIANELLIYKKVKKMEQKINRLEKELKAYD